MKIKKAMILAAGFGSRLKPITSKIPKPLIEIGKKNLLERCLDLLINYGVKDVAINLHYKGDKIRKFLKKKKYKIKINFFEEKKQPLGTGGGVFNATINFDDKPFFIINPDTIWTNKNLIDLRKLEKKYFKDKKTCLLLVDKKLSFDKSFKGDFSINKNSNLFRKNNNNYIYTGIQFINRNVFRYVDSKIFSMNSIWDRLIPSKNISGVISKNKFFHLNTKKVYDKIRNIKF